MPRPQQYTPARRFMMQGIMWVILGATVGLAALVSHQRRSSIDVKLDDLKEYRGVSVQLPRGWEISKKADPMSAVLVSATEKKSSDEDEGPRVVRIVRETLPSYRDPFEYAAARLGHIGQSSQTGKNYVTIAHSQGEMLYQVRITMRNIAQMQVSKSICAATVTPSGRGLAVELDGDGEISESDIDLVKRIAGSIKLGDEPETIDSGLVTLGNGITAPVPADFSTVKSPDPLSPQRFFRGNNSTGPMRTITMLPIVMLPKDGSATILTMLSLCDGHFEDAQVHPDSDGVFRADVDASIRQYLPMRAFAMNKNGNGI